MDVELRNAKRVCRQYLREVYKDGDLIRALDAARKGIICFNSCCCFAGIPHNKGQEITSLPTDQAMDHGHRFHGVYGLTPESYAYLLLDHINDPCRHNGDDLRRKQLIPMILAEIKRRSAERNGVWTTLETTSVMGSMPK